MFVQGAVAHMGRAPLANAIVAGMKALFDRQLMGIPGMRRVTAACAACALAKAATILGQALSLSFAIVMLWEGAPLEAAMPYIALFAACFVGRQLVITAQESYIDSFAAQASEDELVVLLNAAFDAGPALVRETGTAALVANAVDGVRDIEEYLRLAIARGVDMVAIPLLLLVAIFALDVVSGVIALVCYPFAIIFMRLIGLTAKQRAERQHARFERMSNAFVNIAGGVATLKAFGAARRFASRILDASERFRAATMKTLSVAMLSSAVLDLFATLALAAVAIMLGFRMVEETVAFFPALAVLVLVPEYFKPIRDFGGDYHSTLDGRTSLSAIRGFMERAQDPAAHASPFWPEGTPWSKRMCIDTRHHVKTVIFGASGAGKSTMLNVLAGFCDPPRDVEVVLDDSSLPTLREERWQRRVAYIPQTPHIFHASLRENLALYNHDAGDEEISRALDAVGLGDLAATLPDGLDTLLGEGGRALSGGQAQRVALCRALLDPARDVWILDEPSAHLDERTERDLHATFSALMQGKTAFIATHSPVWEEEADQVLLVGSSEGDAS